MSLKNKSIIITGGAVRVGRAISLELASAGAHLFCHYHSSEKEALSLASEIKANGGSIDLYQADLAFIPAIKKMVDHAVQQCGQIDGLVNNAALFYKTPLSQVTEKDWDTFMTLNLKSAFFMSQAVAANMQRHQSGKIINIGDSGAVNPFPAYIPYSISKAGIMSLTKGLAKALAPHIQVNCINPGPVMIPGDMNDPEKRHAVQQTLLKREGTPEDIARTIRFLFEQGDYITGAMIPVDGGREIR